MERKIAKAVGEIDETWAQFVDDMKKIQDRYGVVFVPVNPDLWLNPTCYKIREIKINKGKNSCVLTFDRNKIRHRIRV